MCVISLIASYFKKNVFFKLLLFNSLLKCITYDRIFKVVLILN